MARPLWTTDDVMREALIGIVGLDIDHEQLLSSLLKQQNVCETTPTLIIIVCVSVTMVTDWSIRIWIHC